MTKERDTARGSVDSGRRRSAARLAATQALYQAMLTGAPAPSVVAEFLAHRAGPEPETCPLGSADRELFADIVLGASARRDELDRLIAPALAEGWTLERLETILHVILLAGTYELVGRPDVPAEVVISEYVDVAHAFFSGKEPAFVNGLLDKLARAVRAGAMEARAGGGTECG